MTGKRPRCVAGADGAPGPEVLVVSGPAGVGKSSTAFEASRLLAAANVDHALIDTDELDRLVPPPPDLASLTERNLGAVWAGFRERGARRLIVVGVFLDRATELAWVRRAVGGSRYTVVRLRASEETLAERVRRREIGAGADDQMSRTLAQHRSMEDEGRADLQVVATEGRSVGEVAREVLRCSGWLSPA